MSGSKQRVAVLVDGMNRQRGLHLRSGQGIVDALAESGHEARLVFVDRDVDVSLRQGRYDVGFVATRGRYASDGCLQGLLEMLGIAYTGSGVFASALAMNQAKCKDVLRLHNLPTAPAYVIRADAVGERSVLDHHGSFGFPVVVSAAGAAIGPGMSLASDELELEAAVDDAFRCGDEVLVERLVDGRVVSVAVLDGTPLGALDLGSLVGLLNGSRPERGETRGRTDRTDVRDASNGKLKARFAAARYRSLLRIAQQSCEALGAEGAVLVELTVSDRLNEVVRSVDVAPVLAPASTFTRIAANAGLDFEDLIEEVLRGARLKAHGQRRERRALQVAFTGPERRNGLQALPH
jgi:D-alanine-D-alanine ligase